MSSPTVIKRPNRPSRESAAFVAAARKRRRNRLTRVPEGLWQSGLYRPVNHIVQSSGKRLRAELVELSFRLAGGKGEVSNDLLEFVELLHAGSLVIDDIEDGSHMRRGQPTLHRVFGTPLAINTGNWMYFSALEKLQNLPLAPTQPAQVMGETLSTIRRCHEGQALDIAAKIVELDRLHVYPTVLAITKFKTGGVTALAAKLGAVLAGASTERQAAFHSFGMQLGISLQIQNDFSELKSGCVAGGRTDDLRNSRVTWPWAWASRLRSPRRFVELQCLMLDPSEETFATVAEALHDETKEVCEKSTRRKIDAAIGYLSPNLNQSQSEELKRFVRRIEGYRV